MFRKLTALLIVLMFVLSAVPAYACAPVPVKAPVNYFTPAPVYTPVNWYAPVPVYAANCSLQSPVIYKSDLVVTKAGGVYQVGFATIIIPDGFIGKNRCRWYFM